MLISGELFGTDRSGLPQAPQPEPPEGISHDTPARIRAAIIKNSLFLIVSSFPFYTANPRFSSFPVILNLQLVLVYRVWPGGDP